MAGLWVSDSGARLWKEEQQKPQAANFLVPSHGLSSRTGRTRRRFSNSLTWACAQIGPDPISHFRFEIFSNRKSEFESDPISDLKIFQSGISDFPIPGRTQVGSWELCAPRNETSRRANYGKDRGASDTSESPRSRIPRFPSAFVVFVVWSGCGVGNWRKLTSIWSRPSLTSDHVQMGGVNIGVMAARYANLRYGLGHLHLLTLTWIHRL
jgi:hypothetical protein